MPWIERLFAHDRWANREMLAMLRAGGGEPARAVTLLAHILAAEQLWLERLRGQPPSLPVWPELSLDECAQLLDSLAGAWRAQLAGMADADMDRRVDYTNTRGEPWSNSAGDILTHVVLHSSHHRGQIAAAVRGAGSAPGYTDFIHAVRQGFVE
jgi:uncharacterized damage-inducible protein DinB